MAVDSSGIGAAQIVSGGGALSSYEDYRLGYAPSTRKAAEVMQQVRRAFGDEAGVQINDSDLLSWISDAQDEVVNQNKTLKTRSFQNSIAGVAEYQFPGANILQMDAMHYDGKPLEAITFAQVEQEAGYAGGSEQGTPRLWYEWGGSFRLFPVPAASAQITLFYTARPTRITAANQVLSIPDKYYQAVVDYVTSQALELDDNWQGASVKRQQFSEALTFHGEEERTAQSLTYDTPTWIENDY